MNNENMNFLIERMDRHHEILRNEISNVKEKIDILSGLKNKIIGAAMVISGIVSAAFQYLINKR